MQRGDQRGQLLLRHVLQLVDEKDQGRLAGLRGAAGRFQQGLQVVLEIAVVGQARLGVEVDAHFKIGVLELQGLREAGQRAQAAGGEVLGRLPARQPQQGEAQLRRQHRRQGAALGRFDADGLHAGGLGVLAHAIQQHGLAHAAQADQQHALRLTADADALGGDPHLLDQGIAAGELGGGAPAPGA